MGDEKSMIIAANVKRSAQRRVSEIVPLADCLATPWQIQAGCRQVDGPRAWGDHEDRTGNKTKEGRDTIHAIRLVDVFRGLQEGGGGEERGDED